MLTVFPIQSKDEQKELCALCKIEFNIDAFAYRADDNGFIGICQFYFKDGCGYIQNLTYAEGKDDSEAMIIMLRATMSFMNRCGIGPSFMLDGAAPESLIQISGYRKNESGKLFLDLNKFYGTTCSER